MRCKQYICIIILVMLILSSTTVMVSAENSDDKETSGPVLSFVGGSGTEADPYEISNVTHLQNMNDDLSAHYELINNIDASETVNWNGGKGFLPIGNDSDSSYGFQGTQFSGSLKGQEYFVNNLYINRSNIDCVGLFGGFSGSVIKVGLENVAINGYSWTGSLVGYNNEGSINNCFVNGNVTSGSAGRYTGGLVGMNSGEVKYSYFEGNVTGSQETGGLVGGSIDGTVNYSIADANIDGSERTGGLIGYNTFSSEITNSHAECYVDGSNEVGGLVGENTGESYVNNSYSKGHVEGISNIGGLVGMNEGSTIYDSYSKSNVTGTGDNIGGLIGQNQEYCLINNSYSDGTVIGEQSTGGLVGKNSDSLVNNSHSNSVVTGTIWCGILVGHNEYGLVNNSYVNGELDGDSYLGGIVGANQGGIRNSEAEVTINGSLHVGGISGHSYDVVYNCSSTGTVEGDEHVGGIVGRNDAAPVIDSSSSANISGNTEVGGAVGWNDGGNINNSYFSGVTNGQDRIGGVIGYHQSGSMNWCSNFGEVHGGANTGGVIGYSFYGNTDNSTNIGNVYGDRNVGGLIGKNFGTVNNSYNTGDVEGNITVGGLIGENNLPVFNSYSTGNVSCARNTCGGLIGYNADIVKNSHYNIDDVLINGEHQVTIGGLYDSQYQDWITNGFSLDISDYSSTLVASEEYYDINNVNGIKNLLGFADDDEYKFRFGMDIDLSSEPGLYIPYLAAELYGNEHVVENLYINWTSGLYTEDAQNGFVGHLYETGTIENIGLVSLEVNGYKENGGLVGFNQGTVNNSYAVGKLNGYDSRIGGLIGRNNGLINNSHADVDVIGYIETGGLVGINFGDIEQSFATGDVEALQSDTGGLVGSNQNNIINSFAKGDVNGDFYTGGLVGRNGRTINNTYSTGAVSGDVSTTGGLIGGDWGTVLNSFWDEDTSGMTTSYGGTGKSTSMMKANFTYTDLDTSGLDDPWDFLSDPYDDNNNSDIWDRNNEMNDGYPFIKAIYDSENREPVADAGSSRTVEVNTDFVLDGSGSYDDIEIVNYTWTSGPARTYYGEEVTISFASIGTYPITLNVTDQAGKYDTDSISITTEDTTPPVADAGPDQTVNVGESFTLDGSGSTDNYGIEYYNWTCGSDEYYGETVTLTNDTAGDYTYTLKVTDQYGNYNTDTVNITVELNHTLAADAGSDRTVNVGETVILNASGSTADYEIVNYTWNIEGTEYYGEEITHDFSSPDEYTITLTIEDSQGKTDSDTVNITVIDETPPVADAGEDRTVAVEEVVTFNASGSYDNVEITNYTWNLKGETYYKEEIQHIFINEGVYEATLTVRDEAGNSDTDSVNITVVDQTDPIANAGPDQTVNVSEAFTLNGSDSYDFVGITNYKWTCESTVLHGLEVTHSFSTAGTYTFTLNVTDDAGNYDTDTVNITVVGDTNPPIADAGLDQTVGIDETFTLNGSGSSDEGTIVNYTWVHESLELYGEEVTHSFSTAGTYTFTLNVNDDAGKYDTDTVNITVQDQTPPNADAGGDRTVYVNSSVVFDGSNSTDNVGIVGYTWTIEGGEHNGEEITHTFTNTGTYDVTLNVTDAAGNYDKATIIVTVKEEGKPIAHINGPSAIAMGTTATYNGSESTDDKGIGNYTWTIEGMQYYGEEIEHTFDEAGTYDISLNVSDEDGNYDSTSIEVTVVDSTDPQADAGDDQTVSINEEMTLDGSNSTDNVGIENFEWIIDNKVIYGEVVNYTFDQVGTYTAQLTITDTSGNTDTDSVSITVEDNTPPTADAGSDESIMVNESLTFDGSGSTDNGNIVSYAWSIEDSEYSGMSVTHTFDEAGVYSIELTVTDGGGNSDSDTISVIVESGEGPVATFDLGGDLEEGNQITFDASDSESSYPIESYEWNFGDGTTETGEEVTHIFDESGNYDVSLTITDENGNTAEYEESITIEKGKTDDSDDSGGFSVWLWIAPIIIILLILVIVGYRRMNKPVNDKSNEDSEEYTEENIHDDALLEENEQELMEPQEEGSVESDLQKDENDY